MDDTALAIAVQPFVVKALVAQGWQEAEAQAQVAQALESGHLAQLAALFKDRCDTLLVLADWAARFYAEVVPPADELAQHVTDAIRPVLHALAERLGALADTAWDKATIAALFKEILKEQGLKMPQLAMPVRVLTLGTAHTPSVDAVLIVLGQQKVVTRLKKG